MDDSDSLMSDDEEEIYENSLKELRNGKVPVKNHDGATLRCPYSPGRKKQSYQYKDLLQHAEAVGKGNRGPSAVGKHSALAEYLRTDLASMAPAPMERSHKLELLAPQEKDVNDLLLFPWTGVVYNIQTKPNKDGFIVGPSDPELKIMFNAFQPEKAQAVWEKPGHMGVGFVTFQKDFSGWKSAQEFEKWFSRNEHGKKEWESKKHGGLGTELYGWLARKEDYEGHGDQAVIARHLQKRGPLELKDIGIIGEEINSMHEARVKHLNETVSEKNLEFLKAMEEVQISKMRYENMRRELEEKHRQELRDVTEKAEKSAQDRMNQMKNQQTILQSSQNKLAERLKQLRDREKRVQSQAEKNQLDHEKKENNLRLEMLTRQKELEKQHQADMFSLMDKQQKEAGDFEKWVQLRKLRMAEKHLQEFDKHRLGEIRDAEKFAEALDDPTLFEPSHLKEMKERLASMESEKAQLQEQVVDLKEDVECHNDMIAALTTKERAANDELLEARKVAMEAMKSLGEANLSGKICIKSMGEISAGPWKEACKKKYKYHEDGWDSVFTQKFSLWEEQIRHPEFSPFVPAQNGKPGEKQVDYSNEKLMELKEELGETVVESVVVAVQELEKFNPSGRYPVKQLWNRDAGKVATLAESFEYILSVIKNKPKPKKRKVAG
ncbi:hypothetical protein R1flu_023768 [Riccia fluitans]|uniref:XS domain-containing protein n=1 Tax=Riccia fluitans TaxID=41844 RepID=A0ABD1XVY0_9MARC